MNSKNMSIKGGIEEMANKAVVTIKNQETFNRLKVIASILNISIGDVITKSIESTELFDIAVEQMYEFLLNEETQKQKSNKNK